MYHHKDGVIPRSLCRLGKCWIEVSRWTFMDGHNVLECIGRSSVALPYAVRLHLCLVLKRRVRSVHIQLEIRFSQRTCRERINSVNQIESPKERQYSLSRRRRVKPRKRAPSGSGERRSTIDTRFIAFWRTSEKPILQTGICRLPMRIAYHITGHRNCVTCVHCSATHGLSAARRLSVSRHIRGCHGEVT